MKLHALTQVACSYALLTSLILRPCSLGTRLAIYNLQCLGGLTMADDLNMIIMYTSCYTCCYEHIATRTLPFWQHRKPEVTPKLHGVAYCLVYVCTPQDAPSDPEFKCRGVMDGYDALCFSHHAITR